MTALKHQLSTAVTLEGKRRNTHGLAALKLSSLLRSGLESKMATPDETPVDTRDALEVLESEAKEWEKVCAR